MSIACPMFDGTSTLERLSLGTPHPHEDGRRRARSVKQIDANRRNARRSTGPRTERGKRVASRNALKHGLCRDLSLLPGEDGATFNLFVAELEEELRPATVLQQTLFPQICMLIWQLRRLPEAQTKLFEREVEKVGDVAAGAADGRASELSPAEVLARRFSDDRSNGFLLMNRYERSMQNALLRLLRQFHWLKKHHPTTPHDPDEPPCPPERAGRMPTPAEIERQRDAVRRAGEQRQAHVEREAREMGYTLPRVRETREPVDADPSPAGSRCREPAAPGAGDSGPSERTQTKPSRNPAGESETAKSTDLPSSRITERTQTSDAPAGATRKPPKASAGPPGEPVGM